LCYIFYLHIINECLSNKFYPYSILTGHTKVESVDLLGVKDFVVNSPEFFTLVTTCKLFCWDKKITTVTYYWAFSNWRPNQYLLSTYIGFVSLTNFKVIKVSFFYFRAYFIHTGKFFGPTKPRTLYTPKSWPKPKQIFH
jgi:hypothetical protein